MTAEMKIRESIRGHLARPKERSSLFWWLVENHQWLLEQRGLHKRIMWAALCPEFAALGLTDRTGKPPNPKSAKLTWERVCKEKARIEARQAAADAERAVKAASNPRRNMPSQFGAKYNGPPLAVVPQPPPSEGELWMGKYWFDEAGMIVVIDNPSSGVYAHQERNLRSSRPIKDGIERVIRSKEKP